MAKGGARPNSGRKPTSSKVANLRGTKRADREVKEVDPPTKGPMTCPIHLSELAQVLFADIAGMLEAEKRCSPHYAQHVALLAQRLEQIQRFQAVLESEGDTYTTQSAKKIDGKTIVTELTRARPEVAMLSDAMRHAQSLLGELMLNPASALKLTDGHRPTDDDFEGF